MRRQLPFCLALGALATLFVAWGSATFAEFPNRHERIRFEPLSDREMWSLSLSRTVGGWRYTSVVMPRALRYEAEPPGPEPPGWAALPEPDPTNSVFNPFFEIAEGRGWPRPAFMYRFSNTEGTSKHPAGPVRGGFELQPNSTGAWYDPWVLPYRPIWSGLLIDTAVFTVLWMLVFLVPIALVRRRRRRRGACVACGYDLAGTTGDRCPECGATIDPDIRADTASGDRRA